MAIDERRVPHEINRALDAASILVDQLTPGLSMRREGADVVVVSHERQDLARFPAYRLGAVDKALVASVANEALAWETPEAAAQVFADAHAMGGFHLVGDPASDEVEIRVGDWSVIVARWRVVPGWPAPDEVIRDGD